MCPRKTQFSLGIHPVWSKPSLWAQWVAKDPRFLHADSKDSDQTGRMPRLIWVFAGRTLTSLILSCRGSYNLFIHQFEHSKLSFPITEEKTLPVPQFHIFSVLGRPRQDCHTLVSTPSSPAILCRPPLASLYTSCHNVRKYSLPFVGSVTQILKLNMLKITMQRLKIFYDIWTEAYSHSLALRNLSPASCKGLRLCHINSVARMFYRCFNFYMGQEYFWFYDDFYVRCYSN